MFSFFRRDNSAMSKRENRDQQPSATPLSPPTGQKRTSLVFPSAHSRGQREPRPDRNGLSTLSNSPKQRSGNLTDASGGTLANYSPPMSGKPSGSVAGDRSPRSDAESLGCRRSRQSLQRRFIREVVVDRRKIDDQFDVNIVQENGNLIAIGPGFFPQDRLVSLNDRNLESMPAEKVNRIIRSLAGRTLTVQVLSINTSDVKSKREHFKLKRFGTLRARQECKLAKSVYWLVENNNEYVGVQALEISKTKARVRLLNDLTRIMEVRTDMLEKANDEEFDMSDDLCTLHFLNETCLLHVLKTRLRNGYDHTFIGSGITVVMSSNDCGEKNRRNPSALVAEFKDTYGLRPDCLAPHDFSTGYTVSRNALRTASRQSIVLIGSQRSEKQSVLRNTLTYLALAHFRFSPPAKCCLWIESVCTVVSSVCGTLGRDDFDCTTVFKMGLDGQGTASQFTVETLFVDEAKVFYRRIGSSKILSSVAYCDNQQLVDTLYLDQIDLSDNTFLQKTLDRDLCRLEWRRLFDSFDHLNLDQSVVYFIHTMAAIILHLGSCDISKLSGIDLSMAREACMCFPQFDRCSAILGVDKDVLLDLIFTTDHDNHNPGEITPLLMICGFATTCYRHIIEAALCALNRCIQPSRADDPVRSTITVICLSDLTDFGRIHKDASLDFNASFYDMINNYVNEKVHDTINDMCFKQPQSDLKAECPEFVIEPSRRYPFEPMLSLMEQIGSKLGCSFGGFLRILDQSFFPHEEHIRRICTEVWRSGERTISLVNNPAVFCIYHFGGNLPVIYDPSDWCAVYRDLPSPARFLDIFDFTERDFMKKARSLLFDTNRSQTSSSSETFERKGRRKLSTCDRIELEINHLLTLIRSSNVQLCFCLTPVVDGANSSIRKQLRAFNLLRACQLLQQAPIHKFSHQTFAGKYSCLLPCAPLKTPMQSLSAVELVRSILEEIAISSYSYKITCSAVYVRHFLLKELDFRLEDVMECSIIRLQALARSYLARIQADRHKLRIRALQCVQRNGRIYMNICQWRWWRLLNSIRHASMSDAFKENELATENERLKQRLLVMQNELEGVALSNSDLQNAVNFYKRLVHENRSRKELESDIVNNCREETIPENVQDELTRKDKKIQELESMLSSVSVQPTSVVPCPLPPENEVGFDETMSLRSFDHLQSSSDHLVVELQESLVIAERKILDLQKNEQKAMLVHADLNDELQNLKAANSVLRSQNDQHLRRIKSLEAELEESLSNGAQAPSNDGDVACLSSLKASQMEVKELEDELEEKTERVNLLEQHLLRSDLQLQRERKQHVDELNSKDEEFEHFQSTYQSRIKCLQEKQDELENENSRLRKQARIAEAKLDDAQNSKAGSEEIEMLRLKIVRYKAMLSDARFQIENSSKSDEADLLIKHLRSTIRDMEEENRTLERSKQTFKLKSDELQSQIDELNRQSERLKQENAIIHRENKSLQDDYEEGEKEATKLMNLLKDKAASLSSCQQELKSSQAEANKFRIEVSRLNERISELETKLALNGAVTSPSAADKCEIASAKDCQISDLRDKLAVEELAKKRLQHHVERLREQCQKNSDLYDEASTHISSLEVVLKGVQSELRLCKQDKDILSCELKECQNAKKILEETEAVKSKELSKLRDQMRRTTDRIHRLSDVANEDDGTVCTRTSSSSCISKG